MSVPLASTSVRWTRRRFLGISAGVVLLAACDGGSTSSTRTTGSAGVPLLPDDPFSLGVASGDPTHDGVVLWTRLAPDPLVPGGGMDPVDVTVRWQVGTDDALRDVVRDGTAVARPDGAHALHVLVEGLEPDRPYWYRFALGDHETPIARTRTLPSPDADVSSMRFGFVSCQNYTDGYYNAYRDLASDDLDLVVHLGDYVYESGLDGVRRHDRDEVITLDEYRARYALYKGDAHLRAAHAFAPWLVTWDDHEVENNYTSGVPEADSTTPDPEAFVARRAAAYRAWWEHMPTRLAAPAGPDLRIERRADWGRLARFHVLDTRQYRTDQTCGVDDIGSVCDAALDPAAVVLGDTQERWLLDGLDGSPATWNVLAQQIVFSFVDFLPGPDAVHNLDQWDGYPAARDRLLRFLAQRRPSNPVVITGDIHTSGVSDVLGDFADPASPVVGTELVGTSISSDAPQVLSELVPIVLDNNPHLKWADASHRGWVRCTLTRDEWRADYRLVDDNLVDDSNVRTATSWVIPAGGRVEEA